MLFANDPAFPWHPQSFEMSIIAAGVFGLLGIVLLAVGFKVFELITPKLDIEKELGEKNVAVGIMVAALLLGIAMIVTRAIGG
jgi:putative membrane protein